MRKRMLSAVLAALLLLACLPLSAAAEEDGLPALETEEHILYIDGSEDLVNPEGNLTRSEAAKIICTLLKDEGGPAPQAQTVFPDVPANAWFAPYVQKLTALGIFKGLPDGSFGALNPITRAEFVQALARFFGPEEAQESFTDVPPDHWAYEAVSTAVAKGWTKGYGNGLFEPSRKITRAEAITIMNRVLGRSADKARLDADGKVLRFLDLPLTHWAYYDIMEASLPHVHKEGEAGEEWESYTVPAAQREAGPQYYNGETYYVKDGRYVRSSTIGTLRFRDDGRYTSGDDELDAQLTYIFKNYLSEDKAPIDNLYSAYYYVAEHCNYRANTYLNDGDTGWENQKAKEMIRNRAGNCYNYAGIMTALARKVGYEARAYSGYVKFTFQSYWAYHAWCEVTDSKGARFLCDPDLESQFGRRLGMNWKLFMVPYKQLPFQLREKGVVMQ